MSIWDGWRDLSNKTESKVQEAQWFLAKLCRKNHEYQGDSKQRYSYARGHCNLALLSSHLSRQVFTGSFSHLLHQRDHFLACWNSNREENRKRNQADECPYGQ